MIAVIMCTWRRLDRLDTTLELLENQTYKNFNLYIWNNNDNIKNEIDRKVKHTFHFNISVKHSEKNVGGIGRFIYAKELSDKYEKVVFIDDDQIFKDNTIEIFNSEYEKKTISSWWSWKCHNSYHNRTRVKVGMSLDVDYCGTGGMICDSSIFKDNRLFDLLPEKYKFVEDLWLSQFAKKNNWKLKPSNVDIEIIVDNKDQYVKLRNVKSELYDYLKKLDLKEDIFNVISKLGSFDKVVSLGQNCTSANYIKECNLKKESYPFDWIFSNSKIILNCLNDNFTKFTSKEHLFKITTKKSGHSIYHNKMFNHHDLTDKLDYEYYVRCVNRFLELLNSQKKIVFFTTVLNEIKKQDIWFNKSIIKPNIPQNYKSFKKLESKLLSINPNCKFIYVNQLTGKGKQNLSYKVNDTSLWIDFKSIGNNSGSHYLLKKDGAVINRILKSINIDGNN